MDGPRISESGLELFVARVRQALVGALNDIGERAVEELRESISTPYPPASEPGERPHRRSGALAGGVTHSVQVESEGLELIIEVAREGGNPSIPAFLEHGTSRMRARPYALPSFERWKEEMNNQFPELVKSYYGED